ncbi:MAG: hypothetical protein ABSC00_10685 [Acidimicrobiales bacterium]
MQELRPPYHYGAPVEPPWFCDREAEVAAIESRMRDGIHVFLLSPRRYGKTSLLFRAMTRFGEGGGRVGYANLLLCTNEIEVASSVLSAVVEGVLSGPGRARHALEDVIRRLRVTPQLSVTTDGKVQLSFDPSVGRRVWRDVLEDALGLLEQTSDKRPSALVLDEFQVVAGIGAKGLGGTFKAVADRMRHVSLVFSGSHLSIMEKLTKARGAPLYGMGERIVLDVVPEAPMVSYLQRRARASGMRLSKVTAQRIYVLADTVPNYVQQLAFAAYELAGTSSEITDVHVDKGLSAVTRRQAGDFAEKYEQLSPSQQRILKVLAAEPVSRVYTKSFLDAVDVANANAVTTALRVLGEREMVQRRGGKWAVVDPFLRYWLTS